MRRCVILGAYLIVASCWLNLLVYDPDRLFEPNSMCHQQCFTIHFPYNRLIPGSPQQSEQAFSSSVGKYYLRNVSWGSGYTSTGRGCTGIHPMRSCSHCVPCKSELPSLLRHLLDRFVTWEIFQIWGFKYSKLIKLNQIQSAHDCSVQDVRKQNLTPPLY